MRISAAYRLLWESVIILLACSFSRRVFTFRVLLPKISSAKIYFLFRQINSTSSSALLIMKEISSFQTGVFPPFLATFVKYLEPLNFNTIYGSMVKNMSVLRYSSPLTTRTVSVAPFKFAYDNRLGGCGCLKEEDIPLFFYGSFIMFRAPVIGMDLRALLFLLDDTLET